MLIMTTIPALPVGGASTPFGLSMTVILAILYIVFLAQIFVISIHFPGKVAARIRYVLDNFPPDQYPKLYPSPYDKLPVELRRRSVDLFVNINRAIALVGLMILVAAMATGYEPRLQGGDEILVFGYFVLQIMPLMYQSFKEFQHHKLMRAAFEETRQRSADLKPRHLFDFISPVMIVAAIALYVAWVFFFIDGEGPVSEWDDGTYIALFVITAMNLMYTGVIYVFLRGAKLDPYQAYPDQLRRIEMMIKVHVLSSILVSIFMIMTTAADRYAFEVFDPAMVSVFLQLCLVFGMGLVFKLDPVEETDFEVYRDSQSQENGAMT